MPIKTSCTCGKKYRLKDELAGKRVRCTDCGVVFQVPKEEQEDVESDFEVVEQPKPRRLQAPAEAPPPPPPKKKKRRRPVEDRDSGGGFHISISPGVIGGLLMMIVAVIWFVVGFFAGWIFFYPPILFVLGLIRFVWSLMGGEED